MKPRFLFALVVFALLFTNICYAQITDWNFLGGGARARAMGGAFFGVSDDPSAGSWNPAGLTQMDLPQTNLTFYSGRVKVGHTMIGLSKEVKMSDDMILSGAVVIPFKVSGYDLVGSASYQRLSVFSDNVFYEAINRSEELYGNIDAVTLSLGRELVKGFSLGMALNIYSGGYTFKAFQTDHPFETDGGVDTVWSDSSWFYHPLIEGDYSGFNLHFGTMFKTGNFSLGAVVKTPFTLKEKIDLKMERDLIVGDYVNPGTNRPYGYNTAGNKPENKWKLPLIWGIGSAFRSGNLTIAADIEYRDFSKAELIYKDAYYPTNNSPSKTVNLGWENGTQFRIGGEYIVSTKFGKIPLRAGYRNDPRVFTSMANVVVEIDTSTNEESKMGDLVQTDPGDKGAKVEGSVISFGTGISWNQIMFDVTYEHSEYDYTISGTVKDEVIHIIDADFEDKITNKDNRIMVNFSGFF